MGKLILCNGSYAKEAYHIKAGNINIYSIEELCYYMAHNLDFVIEIPIEDSLIKWINEQLLMEELAGDIKILKDKGEKNSTIIMKILRGCNYFTNHEMKEIGGFIKEFENLPGMKRKIIKANNYLNVKQYQKAEKEYERLLYGEEAVELNENEYAWILHNLGIAKIYTVGTKEAAPFFKEAYGRNHNENSLRQYMAALSLSSQNELFLKEVDYYELDHEWVKNFYEEVNHYKKEARTKIKLSKIEELKELSNSKDKTQFYQTAGQLTMELEEEYRRCIYGNNQKNTFVF